jgi:hypothetical protein
MESPGLEPYLSTILRRISVHIYNFRLKTKLYSEQKGGI